MYKDVIQIVSGSRSGSSLLKTLLAQSPDLDSLDGEEEPYFHYTANGYGFTSDHDGFTEMKNVKLFQECIAREVFCRSEYEAWDWRLRLQFKGATLARLLNELDEMDYDDPMAWLRKMGVAGHYDGCERGERAPFVEFAHEMAPFVLADPHKSFNPKRRPLLLKAPYNVYRPRVLEQIFPAANHLKIVLLRNPAATVNGLIDAWRAPYGFQKHQTPLGWWKFDLPDSSWPSYLAKTTAERAAYQWASSYRRIFEDYQPSTSRYWVLFEELLSDPEDVISRLCNWLGIRPPEDVELPRVMATEIPVPYRWKAREEEILSVLKPHAKLIRDLGYGEPNSQWV